MPCWRVERKSWMSCCPGFSMSWFADGAPVWDAGELSKLYFSIGGTCWSDPARFGITKQ